jgi:hypothetical protein
LIQFHQDDLDICGRLWSLDILAIGHYYPWIHYSKFIFPCHRVVAQYYWAAGPQPGLPAIHRPCICLRNVCSRWLR